MFSRLSKCRLSVLKAVFLLSLMGTAVSSYAQYENLPAEQIYSGEQQQYGHLRYFGFYASAMGGWNYTKELAPFTNLTWIHVGSAEDSAAAIEQMLQRTAEAKVAGVQAVLSIEPFLFKNLQGDPREDVDIEDFLVELRAQLEAQDLLDTVVMIYPKDEPFREFVNYRKPDFYSQYVSGDVYKDIHRDLSRVNSLVKLVFPEKPIGVILSGYELFHKFFSIPENYDWVGFDCYDNLFKACDDKSFVQTYRRLLDHMQPHQNLMAVPEAWALNENLQRADWPAVLKSRLLHHYEMALSEPRFIAFIPFLWSFDAETETPGLGLNQFPDLYDDGLDDSGTALVDLVKQLGIQVKSGSPQYPNMDWAETENSRYRPNSLVRGEILGISGGGMLSAWAIDQALPHKNLRMRVLVRNRQGQVVHKSRFQRTFIDDPALRGGKYFGGAFVGLHGFRYQLPKELLGNNGLMNDLSSSGSALTVELLVYSDGFGPQGMGAELAQLYSVALPERDQLQAASPVQVIPPQQAVKIAGEPAANPQAVLLNVER